MRFRWLSNKDYRFSIRPWLKSEARTKVRVKHGAAWRIRTATIDVACTYANSDVKKVVRKALLVLQSSQPKEMADACFPSQIGNTD